MKWFKERFAGKEDDLLKYFLFFFIAAQGLAIFLVNLLRTENFLFFDNALAIRHAVEMWKNGLFLDNYYYYSTVESDNAAFFAVPLFLLTGNLGLSLAIVHVLLYALCVYLMYSLFKNGGYNTNYGLIALIFLFSPYVISGLDWGNMIFVTVGQYQFRVIVMLSVTNLLLYTLNQQVKKVTFIPLLVFNAILIFWTTLSCGNYVLLMILFPFCLFFVYINCITDKLEINKCAALVLATSVLSCLISLLIRSSAIGETSRSTLPLLTADTFSANLWNCITGFFMLFGGLTQDPLVPIFTFKGILRIVKFIFIAACLVLTYLKRKKLKKNDYLHYMFIFVALVNLAVMILTFTRYGADIFEFRYHIVWGAMLLVTTVASLDVIEHIRLKTLVLVGALFMSAMINAGGFDVIFDDSPSTGTAHEIINIADSEGLNTIYLYYMDSEAAAIRVLDLDKSCMSLTYALGNIYEKTDDFYNDYTEHFTFDEKHLFVCTPEDFAILPEEFQTCYTQISAIDVGNVYIGHQNPWLR